MKIQCNMCDAAEASVFCCPDEAALCWACDQRVHGANKLASKHQRVSLFSSSQNPKCDICQETAGFFFCFEDRALLCRKCDVAIHTANAYVAAHRRFLLTGIKAGLEPVEPNALSSTVNSHSAEKASETMSSSIPHREDFMPASKKLKDTIQVESGVTDFDPNKVPSAALSPPPSFSQWNLDDFLGLTEFDQNYGFMDKTSSKADSGKLRELDCSPTSRVADGELGDDEFLGQVPDISRAVPQIPSPPTASGLFVPMSYLSHHGNNVFVPDIQYL